MARSVIAMSSSTAIVPVMLTVRMITVVTIGTICVALSPVITQTFSLVRLHFGEVARRNNDYQHEEHKYDHYVEAELAAYLNLAGDAAAIRALSTLALCLTFTLVKVLLHTLCAMQGASSAVAERAAWFQSAICIQSARLNTLDHR